MLAKHKLSHKADTLFVDLDMSTYKFVKASITKCGIRVGEGRFVKRWNSVSCKNCHRAKK